MKRHVVYQFLKRYQSNKRRRVRGKVRCAFTLIELLVVIAIIALLIGILLPSLQAAKEVARATVCKAQLSNLGRAVHMYAVTHGDRFPNGGQQGISGAIIPSRMDQYGNTKYDNWSVFYQISSHFDQQNVFDRLKNSMDPNDAVAEALEAYFDVLRCPSDTRQITAGQGLSISSYAGCAGVVGQVLDDQYGQPVAIDTSSQGLSGPWPDNGAIVPNTHSLSFGQIPDGTANTFLFGEKNNDTGDQNGWWYGYPGDADTVRLIEVLPNGRPNLFENGKMPPGEEVLWGAAFGMNHPNGINMLFCDGHTQFINEGISGEVFARLGHRSDGLPTSNNY